MKQENDEMREEYNRKDLGDGIRGKYYPDFVRTHNIVKLNPEVAEAFPSEQAVNDALTALIRIAKATTSVSESSSDRS